MSEVDLHCQIWYSDWKTHPVSILLCNKDQTRPCFTSVLADLWGSYDFVGMICIFKYLEADISLAYVIITRTESKFVVRSLLAKHEHTQYQIANIKV